jgi:hypothetical protein
MMFFFRRKQIVLDCFTDDQVLYDYLAPDKATKFYPEWWKNLEPSYKEHKTPVPAATMKGCRGLIEFHRNAIAIPMWSDLYVEVGDLKTKVIRQAIMNTPSTQHPAQQRGTWLPAQKYGHAKFDCPWVFKTKEYVQFMLMEAFYNLDKPEDLMIPPGIVDFKYQQGANINVLFDYREQKRDVIIKAGDPLMFMIPLTEREVVIKKHKVTSQEYRDLKILPYTFSNHYGFNKKVIDKAEAEKKGCPFGFGK